MTLIDHLMETGRVPDTAAEQLFANVAAENRSPDVGPAVAPDPTGSDATSGQRLDHNAASPQGAKSLAAVYGYVRQSGLPSRLVDLVYLRVSQLNGCAYCIDMHSRDLTKAQVPAEYLLLLPVWREADRLFDNRERAALAWAETVTKLDEHGVPDSAYEAARAIFSEKELADLTIAIGLMGAYNRLAISFRTPPQTLSSQPAQ